MSETRSKKRVRFSTEHEVHSYVKEDEEDSDGPLGHAARGGLDDELDELDGDDDDGGAGGIGEDGGDGLLGAADRDACFLQQKQDGFLAQFTACEGS